MSQHPPDETAPRASHVAPVETLAATAQVQEKSHGNTKNTTNHPADTSPTPASKERFDNAISLHTAKQNRTMKHTDDVNDSAEGESIKQDRSALTDRQREVLEFIEQQIQKDGYPPTIREIGRSLNIRSTNGVSDHLKTLEKKGYLYREGQKSRTLRVLRGVDGGKAPEGVEALVTSPTTDAVRPALSLASNNTSSNHDAARSHPQITSSTTSNAQNNSVANVVPLYKTDEDTGTVLVPVLGKVAAGAPLLATDGIENTLRLPHFLLGPGTTEGNIFALRVSGDSMIEDGIFDGDLIFVKKQNVANKGSTVVAIIENEVTVKNYFPEGDRVRLQPANSKLQPIYVEKSAFKQSGILGVVVGVYRKL